MKVISTRFYTFDKNVQPDKNASKFCCFNFGANDSFVSSKASKPNNVISEEYFVKKLDEFCSNHNFFVSDPEDFKSVCLDEKGQFNKTAVDTGLKLCTNLIDGKKDFGLELRHSIWLIEICKNKDGSFKTGAVESLTKKIPENLIIKDQIEYYIYLADRLRVSLDSKGKFDEKAFDLFNELTISHPDMDYLKDIKEMINLARNKSGKVDTVTKEMISKLVETHGLPFAKKLFPKLKKENGTFNPNAFKAWERLNKDFEGITKLEWLDAIKGANDTYPDDIYNAFVYFRSLSKYISVDLTQNCKNKKGEFCPKIFNFQKKLLKTELDHSVKKLIPYIKNKNEDDIDKEKYKAVQKLNDNGVYVFDENILSLIRRSADINNLTDKIIEHKDIVHSKKEYLGSIINACTDEKGNFDEEKLLSFERLLKSAIKNKSVLRPANEILSDEAIKECLFDWGSYAIPALSLLGEKNLENAFSMKMDGFGNFVYKLFMLDSGLPKDLKQELLKLTNPKNCEQYKQLDKEKKLLKIKMNKLLSSDEKRNVMKSKNELRILFENNSLLKKDLDLNILTEVEKEEILKKIKNNNEKIKALKMTLKKIADKHPVLQKRINEIDIKMRNLTNKAIKDPKEAIKCSLIFYAFADKENQKHLKKIVPFMNPSTEDEKEHYLRVLNELVFKKAGVTYDKEIAGKVNLLSSPYLKEVLTANEDFYENFGSLLKLVKQNPKLSVADILNNLPQNIETKKQFEALGINYDKWVKTDKNSYVKVDILTDAQQARQSAIKNLEADFNDDSFKKLPKEEQNRLIDVLSANDVELILKKEAQFDKDGYLTGYKKVYRMYKNNEPVKFEMLEKLISDLKKDMNSNPFWDELSDENQGNNHKSTIYNHIIKLRYNDVKNALKVKDTKESELEVHKADMNNISHSLFLGNHACCCTAADSDLNGWSAPNYIKNKLISCIELMDGNNFVGNTMCFLANVDGETSLVLDNIELSSQYQYNDKIRDAFVEYAKKLTAEIGKPDMPIYAGPNRHKADLNIYPLKERNIKILGSSGTDELYIDYDTNAHIINGAQMDCAELYKIR